MLFRSVTLAAFAIALSACTTSTDGSTPSFTQKSPVETRWVGQSAGIFFAKFGPPLSDTESGSSTVYNWRGGYKKATIPAKAGRFRPPAPPLFPARCSWSSPAITRSPPCARSPIARASTVRATARNSSPPTDRQPQAKMHEGPPRTGGPFHFFGISVIILKKIVPEAAPCGS